MTEITGDIMLLEVRLAFPALFTMRAFKPGDDPRYLATFIFPREHHAFTKMRELIKQVAAEKWDTRANNVIKELLAKDRLCLHDGSAKSEYAGFEGNMFVTASSKIRPLVLHRNRAPIAESDGIIYAGCVVNAKINVWAQDNQYGKRINAQLMGVQFVRDDEAFSGAGRVAKSDEFSDYGDVDTGGSGVNDLIDDIPF